MKKPQDKTTPPWRVRPSVVGAIAVIILGIVLTGLSLSEIEDAMHLPYFPPAIGGICIVLGLCALPPLRQATRDSSKGKRIILVGAAGSGKDFLRDHFKYLGFSVDVSYTTRPMREGEEKNVTYHYITNTAFSLRKFANMFYEHVKFNKAKYGTSRKSWLNSDIFIMTPSGVKCITEEDRKDCCIVYLNINESTRRRRMSGRSDNGFDQVERRIAADKEDFKGFFGKADVVITHPMFDPDKMVNRIIEKTKS